MIFPVVAYAPTAATKPSIAAHPLNLSASGVMSLSSLGVVNCVCNFIVNEMCDKSVTVIVRYGIR